MSSLSSELVSLQSRLPVIHFQKQVGQRCKRYQKRLLEFG